MRLCVFSCPQLPGQAASTALFTGPSLLAGLEGDNREKEGDSPRRGLRVTSHPPNAKSGSGPAEGRNFPPSAPHRLPRASPRARASSQAASWGARHGLTRDRLAPAAGLAAPRRQAEPVPGVAAGSDLEPGRDGGAEVPGAAVQPDVGLLVALPAARRRRQSHLPPIPLPKQAQGGRGAGHPAVLGQEVGGHLRPHPERLPPRERGLLFLLGPEQLHHVLQPLRAGLPAREPKTCLQMSPACGQIGRQAQPFGEIRLTLCNSHYITSN
ncbi:T-cell surface glycoprotein CD8 alpha chain isoform X3 [Pan troglodytes]|uniref:T-cell surface glycoprotein CD8 alpha chain isoform X3 n=1 Tax=Pan troglodytes TaxID=9598 RepID=UPI0007DBBD23|nr:T-cell surface glycoprotein CD8 alpha chain isoform X4 [Pan troglodytes]